MLSRAFIAFYIFVVLIVIGFSLSTNGKIPANARILIDHGNKLYYSPVYLQETHAELTSTLVAGRLSDIQNTDIQPDEDCWNHGCFVEYPVSLNQALLEYVGILEPRQRRWTETGEWNY